MLRSTDRIMTTHAGALPRENALRAQVFARSNREPYDKAELATSLRDAVAQTVRKQVAIGIDSVKDGELGKSNFTSYIHERLAGIEAREPKPGEDTGFTSLIRREIGRYGAYYRKMVQLFPATKRPSIVCNGPLKYAGQHLLKEDIDNFHGALAGASVADRDEVLTDVTAKIGRIIGIAGRDQAVVQHPLQRVFDEVAHDPQAQVGQRAHGERRALARKTRDQRLILQRAIAVIDPADAEVVERLPHVLRWSLFAGMRDRKKAGVAGTAEHVLELARRIADLGRVKPDAHDLVAMRQRPVEGLLGAGFVEMTEETHDQVCLDPEFAPSVADRPREPVDHGRERNPARGMSLRVEKHLDVADVVGVHPL